MDTGKLITVAAVGLGLYVLYEWLFSQCESTGSALFGSSTCSMLLGTSTLPAVTVPTTIPVTSTPVSTTPAQSSTVTVANLLTQAANTAGVDPNNLTPDQWSTLYQGIPGKPAIAPATFESILSNLGLSDGTRSTVVTATQFANALLSQGLSGAPMYSQNWVPGLAIHGGRL